MVAAVEGYSFTNTERGMKRTLTQEIKKRAHYIEGQGDGIYMVLIRMDQIIAAVRGFRRRSKRRATPVSPAGRWRR